MKALLTQKFERLEQLRADIGRQLALVSDELANQSPVPGAWSAVQVVAHLQQIEDAYYRYLTKKMQHADDLKRQTTWEMLRFSLLKPYLYSPIKFKAPKGPASDLPEYLEVVEAMERWATTRQKWQDLLANFPPKHLYHAVAKHPMTGRMRLDQLLDFFFWHGDRHRKQIERTLAAVKTARPA